MKNEPIVQVKSSQVKIVLKKSQTQGICTVWILSLWCMNLVFNLSWVILKTGSSCLSWKIVVTKKKPLNHQKFISSFTALLFTVLSSACCRTYHCACDPNISKYKLPQPSFKNKECFFGDDYFW